MRILDIGCNGRKYKSKSSDDVVIGLDIQQFPDVDVLHDLEKAPLPFDDESFDMVYSKHSLEHVVNRVRLLDEIWRILKPNGIFECIVPHHSNPTGKSFEHTSFYGFDAFCGIVPEQKEKYIRGRFEIIERKIKLIRPFGFLEPLANRFPNFYEWRMPAFVPAVELHFKLRKVPNE